MEKLLQALAGALVFGFGGLVLLLRARQVQELAIRKQAQDWTARFNPFAGFVRTPSFLSWLHLLGILFSGAAVILLIVAYQRVR
jgi:type II secretory pathway component PulF